MQDGRFQREWACVDSEMGDRADISKRMAQRGVFCPNGNPPLSRFCQRRSYTHSTWSLASLVSADNVSSPLRHDLVRRQTSFGCYFNPWWRVIAGGSLFSKRHNVEMSTCDTRDRSGMDYLIGTVWGMKRTRISDVLETGMAGSTSSNRQEGRGFKLEMCTGGTDHFRALSLKAYV